jgi:preprotein translocase subunit SecE
MNARAETQGGGADTAKLAAAALLLVGAIFGFYYFAGYSLLLRVIGLLVVVGIGAAVALQTAAGRRLWQFALDARAEVRKVVWPTRQETMQTTLIVVVMVLILGILMWLFDMVLVAILRALTGAGGN